jgi:hypothetical protein
VTAPIPARSALDSCLAILLSTRKCVVFVLKLAIAVRQSVVNTIATTANVAPNLVGDVPNLVGKWLLQWHSDLGYFESIVHNSNENPRVKCWL